MGSCAGQAPETQETCTRIWNTMYPLVTSVSTGQRWWKEAILSYIKDTVVQMLGKKLQKGES